MARKKVDTRQILCSFCEKPYYIKDGGWVVAGDKRIYCHSLEGSCLVTKLNQEGQKNGRRASISEMWKEC